ncbi:MAG: hypothetical protein QHG99_02970 [Methanomicrobiales archaeon]|nr:hypothetical protein [Methanomicrobiales archaeon]
MPLSPIGLDFNGSSTRTNPDLPYYGYLQCMYGNYPMTPYLVSGIGAEFDVKVGSNLYPEFQSRYGGINEFGTFSKGAVAGG